MSDSSYITIPFDVYGRNKALSAYVLNPVREPICTIEGITQFDLSPKFNDISEIQFEVQRFVTNLSTLEWQENPAYQYLHSFAQIYIPELGNKGYFIIHTEPTVNVEGTRQESKSFTAMSYESVLEFESLVGFSINCGTVESKEMFKENLDEIGAPIERIRLYDQRNPQLSLMHWVLKDDYYGWHVGHVDTSIAGLERAFEIDNQNTYSFLHADVSKAFRCIFDFDTKRKEINIYDIETVGKDTNVYLSIEHFLQQVQIAPHNENIYTVFNVQGADNLGIDLVNFGSEKIINVDYPLSMVDEDLYRRYKEYEGIRESLRDAYFATMKEYGNLLNQQASLLDRQPVDAVNNNWSSTVYYSLDELRVTLGAFKQICQTIEGLYKDSPTSGVNYEELNLSPDASLYYSYRDICIPDIEAEIKKRTEDPHGEAERVDQEFVWETYGLNDLIVEGKKLANQIEAYEKQGYNGAWEDSQFLDRDEFNAHHEDYLELKKHREECQDLIDKKTAQNEEIKRKLEEIKERLKGIANGASLSGCGLFTEKEVANIKELYRESDYSNENYLITEYDDLVSEAVMQKQLFDAAAKELEIESRPQYVWSVTSDDLFAMKEFDALKQQLQLGDFVWLGRNSKANPYWTIDKQKFRVIQLDFSGLKSNTSFTITFSTMIESGLDRNDFEQLLDNAITSSVNSISVGVANKATADAKVVMNSLMKPYLEALNAKIDNLEAQNISVQDLKATSALIEHLTVFDLMAGEITADKSIVLTSRDGYGAIEIENSTMKFVDANGDNRVVIGLGIGGQYEVSIYGPADSYGNQDLLWGSNGISDAAIANALISNRMMAWNGIAYGVDTDGRPMWGADKVMLDGERLPDRWESLKDELSSVEILATSQTFIEEDGIVKPSSITLTPVLHILSDMSKIKWFYHTTNSSTWSELVDVQGIFIDENYVVSIASSCPLYNSNNNSIVFKAAYVENDVERYADIVSVFRLTNAEGGGTGESAYTVILSNEAQTVATDSDYFPVGNSTYTCTVRAFYGTHELTAVTNPTLGTGTFSVTATTTEAGASLDYSTPGVIDVTMNTSRKIHSNFDVVLTITIPELDTTLTRMISFSASAAGESPVIVQIDSSTGIIFKNKTSSTLLTCTVTKGTEDITSRVTKFTWKKRDKNGNIDPTWTRELTGNTLPISADDVTGQAVFYCEVSFD